MSRPHLGRTATGDKVQIWKATITKWQVKVLLVVFGVVIVGSVLLYSKALVDELVANERRTVELYARQLTALQTANTDEELLYYIDVTAASINFPVITTDRSNKPVYPFALFVLNVEIDSTETIEQQRQTLTDLIEEMRSEYPPFDIKDANGKVLQRIFYTNSALVQRLTFLPFVEIGIVSAFIIFGYVAFSSIRRSEESNIWVGMAKEAAHQLGTPLSSLLAWLELLRLNKDDPALVVETAQEMQRDVERLNVIANRFSKIGSQPVLATVTVADIVEAVCRYFETRLPNLGKRIELARHLDAAITANVNVDLFQWVLENLIRNAVDAMERPDGLIEISVAAKPRGGVLILVKDNGKGMTSQVRSKVFQPGYTTKRRGWGLGLSLSKRIVEEYHGGRLYVRDTSPGVGTTFGVELP
jgi:signal transduction histidine kinase